MGEQWLDTHSEAFPLASPRPGLEPGSSRYVLQLCALSAYRSWFTLQDTFGPLVDGFSGSYSIRALIFSIKYSSMAATFSASRTGSSSARPSSDKLCVDSHSEGWLAGWLQVIGSEWAVSVVLPARLLLSSRTSPFSPSSRRRLSTTLYSSASSYYFSFFLEFFLTFSLFLKRVTILILQTTALLL